MSKVCTQCKAIKELDKFSILKSSKDGRNSVCKECRNKKAREKRNPKQVTGSKVCMNCNQYKYVSEFWGNKMNSDGLQTYCKICSKNRTHECASSFEGYMKYLYTSLKQNALKRNITVDITSNDIINLYHYQCGKCSLTGRTMTHTRQDPDKTVGAKYHNNISVDRIDSNKGYTPDNIQLVCAIINIMKWDLSMDSVLHFAKAVVANSQNKLK